MVAELSAAAYEDERRLKEKESKTQTTSKSGLSSSTFTSTSSSSVKVKGTTVEGCESSTNPPSVSVGEAGFQADNADARPSTPQHIVGDFVSMSMGAEVKRVSPEASQTTVTSGKESDLGGGGVASTDDDGGYGEDEFEDF
jgi:hypothetical protein